MDRILCPPKKTDAVFQTSESTDPRSPRQHACFFAPHNSLFFLLSLCLFVIVAGYVKMTYVVVVEGVVCVVCEWA